MLKKIPFPYPIIAYSFCLLIFFNCSHKDKDSRVEAIDIDKSKPQNLSKLIETIEYVVMQNPNQQLAQVDKLFVFEEGYILADIYGNHSVLHYNEYGKFLNSIGKRGEGPEEYMNITDADFNSLTKKLEILTPNRLLSYGLNGEFIDAIKFDYRPYKFLILNENKYLFYVPQVLASELREGFEKAILYHFSPEKKNLEPVMEPIFSDVLNYIGEKNNLFKKEGSVIFSSSFCDTIYFISEKEINKKFFLDFGSSQNDLSKLYSIPILDLVEKVNSSEFNNIAIHMPHLFANSRYLSSAFRQKPGVHFFVYDMKEKIPYVSSKTVNDVDGGLGFGIIKMMDEDYFFSFFEPEEILQHYEKNIDQLKDQDNNFTKLARHISRDDFLILAKYKLKK